MYRKEYYDDRQGKCITCAEYVDDDACWCCLNCGDFACEDCLVHDHETGEPFCKKCWKEIKNNPLIQSKDKIWTRIKHD